MVIPAKALLERILLLLHPLQRHLGSSWRAGLNVFAAHLGSVVGVVEQRHLVHKPLALGRPSQPVSEGAGGLGHHQRVVEIVVAAAVERLEFAAAEVARGKLGQALPGRSLRSEDRGD